MALGLVFKFTISLDIPPPLAGRSTSIKVDSHRVQIVDSSTTQKQLVARFSDLEPHREGFIAQRQSVQFTSSALFIDRCLIELSRLPKGAPRVGPLQLTPSPEESATTQVDYLLDFCLVEMNPSVAGESNVRQCIDEDTGKTCVILGKMARTETSDI